jgi:lysophospholipase L1-like esterase
MCLTLSALEVAARSFVALKRIPRVRLLLNTDLGLYAPHPYLGYVPRPGYRRDDYHDGCLSINTMGFRGPEIERVKKANCVRIVCLGGSTTFSARAGNATTYPRLLETKLDATYSPVEIEIINAGVGGYTSAESLVNFQLRVLDLKPDLVIVYHGINDIHPRVVPGFATDYSHYRKPSQPPQRTVSDAVAEWSTLYACLRYRFLVDHRNNLIRMTTKVPYYLVPLDIQAKSFATTTPDTFRRNIKTIVQLAKANGVRVVLSTFTYSRSLHDRMYTAYHSGSYYRGYQQHNAVMTEICRKEGLLNVDLASRFPNDDESLFSGPVHLNSRGTEIKAQVFHDELVNARIIDQIVNSRPDSKGNLPITLQ